MSIYSKCKLASTLVTILFPVESYHGKMQLTQTAKPLLYIFSSDIDCGAGEFECYTGGCVDRVKRCNDIQECQDNSDETNHWCSMFFIYLGGYFHHHHSGTASCVFKQCIMYLQPICCSSVLYIYIYKIICKWNTGIVSDFTMFNPA